MTQTVDSVQALVQRIQIMQAEQPRNQRLIVAMAGAPGAGKSTLAAEVCARLNASPGEDARGNAGNTARTASTDIPSEGIKMPNRHDDEAMAAAAGKASVTSAVVVPMDGFHLDNALLIERGLMAVKGSPQTFDVAGFVALMQRLAEPGGGEIYIPVFDRSADLSRNAAQCVADKHSVIIVEGNYLLLARPGWQSLASLFHLSVMLDVPMEVLEQRLVQRWLAHGLEPDAARQRALSNDIPNARVVMQESRGAHLFFKSVRQ